MMEQPYREQADLFTATHQFLAPGAPSRRRSDRDRSDEELTAVEALSNAGRWLTARGSGGESSEGDLHENEAHLPGNGEIPEIYALCPGCEVHPGGGIYPATELVRAEGCLAGERLRATNPALREYAGEGECHRAEREGLASWDAERREPSLPSSAPVLFDSEGGVPPTGAVCGGYLFRLTIPVRVCSSLYSELERRVRRTWYFHRRRAICRQRLSRIASSPSWSS